MIRSVVCVLAFVGLTGCESVPDQLAALPGVAGLAATPDATGQGIRTLSLLGGDVRVRSPEGYCIDQRASRARGGFAVMAGCALMTSDVAVMPSIDGLLIVQVGEEETGDILRGEAALASFLETTEGKAILSGGGAAGSVTGVDARADDLGVIVRFTDASDDGMQGTTGPIWRGFMTIDDRLTTVSVRSFDRNPLSSASGERLLLVAMAELARANAPAGGNS